MKLKNPSPPQRGNIHTRLFPVGICKSKILETTTCSSTGYWLNDWWSSHTVQHHEAERQMMKTNNTREFLGRIATWKENRTSYAVCCLLYTFCVTYTRKGISGHRRKHGKCQRNGLQKISKRKWRKPQQVCSNQKKAVSQKPRIEQGHQLPATEVTSDLRKPGSSRSPIDSEKRSKQKRSLEIKIREGLVVMEIPKTEATRVQCCPRWRTGGKARLNPREPDMWKRGVIDARWDLWTERAG